MWIKIMILVFVASCSNINTLNLKTHVFFRSSQKIVWIQIAGFLPEHVSMLRFNRLNSTEFSPFENFLCLGNIWNYNLYNLRPTAYTSFQSQITGKKNIKNQCSDFRFRPIWDYYQNIQTPAGFFESGANNSITEFDQCQGSHKAFQYKNMFYWVMGKAVKKNYHWFHFLDQNEFTEPGLYYDRSCQKGRCNTTLYNNIKSVYNRFSKEKDKYFFLIRDFSYYNSLKKGNIPESIEILNDLERVISLFKEKADKLQDMLFIVSSASGQVIDLPKEGDDWDKFFNKKNKNVILKTNLNSVVLAEGAGAENFCGVYEESDLLYRILWRAKKSNLWKYMNVGRDD